MTIAIIISAFFGLSVLTGVWDLVDRLKNSEEENEHLKRLVRHYERAETHEYTLKIKSTDTEALDRLKEEMSKGRVVPVNEEELVDGGKTSKD